MKVYDEGGVLQVTPSISKTRFLVYLSANQNIANTTYTKVEFDTVEFDINSDFDTTNNKFTVTRAGIYLVSTQIAIDDLDNTDNGHCFIYKNGAAYHRTGIVAAVNTQYMYLPCPLRPMQLAVNDYIETYGYHNEGATQALVGGDSIRTFLSVVEL